MMIRCSCTTITQGHIARSPSCPLHGLTSQYARDCATEAANGRPLKVPDVLTQHEDFSGYRLTPDGFVPKKDR
jgi:hypothetical protein